jgi:hypothetical protein
MFLQDRKQIGVEVNVAETKYVNGTHPKSGAFGVQQGKQGTDRSSIGIQGHCCNSVMEAATDRRVRRALFTLKCKERLINYFRIEVSVNNTDTYKVCRIMNSASECHSVRMSAHTARVSAVALCGCYGGGGGGK